MLTVNESIRPWLLPACAVVLLLVLAGVWNRDHRQLVEARRAAEAAQLTLKGQIVTAQESARTLKADVAKLLAENDDLRAAYESARAAAPGAQPIHAATLSTGQLEVAAAPRASPIAPVPPPSSSIAAPAAPSYGISPQGCVLAAGDTASIEVQEVTLQTKDGNILVVGTAAAWRESPLRAKLFGGKFQSSVSDASGLAPPAAPRWGAGAGLACFAPGCDAGPMVLFPPLRVLGFQVESSASLLVGPLGAGVQAAAGIRW